MSQFGLILSLKCGQLNGDLGIQLQDVDIIVLEGKFNGDINIRAGKYTSVVLRNGVVNGDIDVQASQFYVVESTINGDIMPKQTLYTQDYIFDTTDWHNLGIPNTSFSVGDDISIKIPADGPRHVIYTVEVSSINSDVRIITGTEPQTGSSDQHSEKQTSANSFADYNNRMQEWIADKGDDKSPPQFYVFGTDSADIIKDRILSWTLSDLRKAWVQWHEDRPWFKSEVNKQHSRFVFQILTDRRNALRGLK